MFDKVKQKLFGSVGLVVSNENIKNRSLITTGFRLDTLEKFNYLDKLSKTIDVKCGDIYCVLYGHITFINDILTYNTTYKKAHSIKLGKRYFSIIKSIDFEEIALVDDVNSDEDRIDDELAQLTNDDSIKRFFEEFGSCDHM